jgi:hypothetical protein
MKAFMIVPAMVLALFALAACDAPQDGGVPPADAPMDTAPLQ